MRRAVIAMGAASGLLAAVVVAALPVGCSDEPSGPLPPSDAASDTQVSSGDGGVRDDATVTPRGTRVLGLAVEIGDVDFQSNVRTARDAGAQTTNLTFGWDDVERAVDAGDAGDADADASAAPTQLFNPLLHVANLVLPDERMGAIVTLDAVDVSGARAPATLAGRALDDAELGARYDRLTDYALDQLPDVSVTALFFASNVDIPLGDDPAKHAAFATFITRAAAHVHASRPKMKVGFVVTASGAVAARERFKAAWAASDVIGLTYLPVDAAAQVRPVSAIGSDLDQLIAALPPGVPVVVREAGYPAATENGSTEAAQAEFVSVAFSAWDRHADRLSVVTFRELVDLEPTRAANLALRYGRSDPAFLGFLGSLGLRSASRPKPSFAALVSEARGRGF